MSTNNGDRIPIYYIPVMPTEWNALRHGLRVFESKETDDYPWAQGEKPKIYRRGLISLITVKRNARLPLMGHLEKLRKEGYLEGLMFDSGGFQMFRRTGYTIERLERDNLHLYQEQPWADSYVLPDFPTPPDDPLPVMEEKARRTMEASVNFFNKLPQNLKEKSMPVFHVRTEDHLAEQIKTYSEILDASNQACYAIPGIRKRLDLKSMELIHMLVQERPGLKIHSLGVASLPAAYCMHRLGIHTYDAVSPTLSAAMGLLHFGDELVSFTDRREDNPNASKVKRRRQGSKHGNVTLEELEQLRIDTGHRCPFCDKPEELKRNMEYRQLHNLIVFDEFNLYLRHYTMDNFNKRWPQLHDWLASVLGESEQPTLF